MMYFRGQPEDYDEWERLGARGWSGDAMWAVFRAMESHALGADDERGGDGPLKVSIDQPRTQLSEALIEAAAAMGVPRKEDLNRRDHEGIGYGPCTISGGRRQSAARAFLRPALRRANLQVMTDTLVERVIFDDMRAVAVAVRRDGFHQMLRCRGEIILSAGALQSAKLLQLSGIGAADVLCRAGIPVRVANPHVGRHMREHRLLMMQYRLARPLSDNRQFSGLNLLWNVLRYQIMRSGPMAYASYQVAGFVRSRPGLDRPDAELLAASCSLDVNAKGLALEKRHGIHLFGYPLRSRSEGAVEIRSADTDAPPVIVPNYLADPYDRDVTVAIFRLIRRWMAQPRLAEIVAEETFPGPDIESDGQIIDAFGKFGHAGFHACGTTRMGREGDSVLDERLRVYGVRALRVVDGGIMPTMVSANTNGPIMAIGWHAAGLIAQDRRQLSMSANAVSHPQGAVIDSALQ